MPEFLQAGRTPKNVCRTGVGCPPVRPVAGRATGSAGHGDWVDGTAAREVDVVPRCERLLRCFQIRHFGDVKALDLRRTQFPGV